MAQDGAPRRRAPLVFPIVLILLGAMFLYANWSPAFDPWSIVATYWPLILIIIGLAKIWDYTRPRESGAPSSSIGSTVAIVGVVLIVAIFFWHGRAFSHGRPFSRASRHDAQTIDLQGAKKVTVSMNLGAGQVTLRGGASHLLDANFDYYENEGVPQVEYSVNDGVGHLHISQEQVRTNFGRTHNNWSLNFGNQVPLDLRVDMGAGEGDLRLRDLDISNLNINIGAGRVEVDLTGDRKHSINGTIEGGVGQAIIRLPRNVGVVVNASGGIGSIDASGFHDDGDEYTNEAYGKSPVTIHLKVEGGVGQISLIEEP